MNLFGKAKEMAADVSEKVAGMADSAKEAIVTKTVYQVIDTKAIGADELDARLNALVAKYKTVDVVGVGNFCVAKVTY